MCHQQLIDYGPSEQLFQFQTIKDVVTQDIHLISEIASILFMAGFAKAQ